MAKDLTKLSHNELIKLCACDERDENIFYEFFHRYNEFLRLVILRECNLKKITKSKEQLNSILQDLVQDVYVRLFDKNCKALKDFKGQAENSIFLYLSIIARNTIINYIIKLNAQKRPIIEKSIEQPVDISNEFDQVPLLDRLKSDELNLEDEIIEKEEILYYLNEIVVGKHKDRDVLIFRLFIDGFLPEDIAAQFNIGLSAKRVSNIISEIKQALRIFLISQNVLSQ